MGSFKICNKALPFVLVFLIPSIFSMRLNNPDHQVPPIITLLSYILQDSFKALPADARFQYLDQFENDFVSKDKTDYVISSEVISLVFTCSAAYPIMWDFAVGKNFNQNFELSETRSSAFGLDHSGPKNINFTSSLVVKFYSEQFFSKSFPCVSTAVEANQSKSEVHIFLNATDPIENKGKILQLYGDSTNTTITFPCRPSSPAIRLLLGWEWPPSPKEKPISERNWITLSLSNIGDNFDPKVGFIFQKKHLTNGIKGLYCCSIIETAIDVETFKQTILNGDYVIFNVTSKTLNIDTVHSESHSFLKGNASVYVREQFTRRHNTRRDIFCCSGIKDKPPLMRARSCEGRHHCELVAKSLSAKLWDTNTHKTTKNRWRKTSYYYKNVSDDCSKYPLHENVGIVIICQGENVDYLEKFGCLFHSSAEGLVAGRSRSLQNSASQKSGSLSKFVTLSTAKNASVLEKVIILVGSQIPGRLHHKHSVEFVDSIGTDTSSDIFSILMNDAGILGESSLAAYFEEYDRDVYYAGEPLIFMCLGIKYFYAGDPYLRLNWANGSKTLLESSPTVSSKTDKVRFLYLKGNDYMLNRNGYLVVDKFSKTILARLEMSSVDCWMPGRESEKWDKVSKKLQVLPSVAPKFSEKLDESVYFYLGELGRSVVCRVVEGLPMPQLTATLNGIQLNSKDRTKDSTSITNLTETVDKIKNLIILQVSFTKISHEHRSVLKCIARNANSTVIRTIKIFVIERSGNAIQILLILVGILSVVFAALIGRYWYLKLMPVLGMT